MVVTTTLTKLMMIHDNAKEEEMKSAKPQKESRRWDAPALCEKRLQAPKIGADGGGVGNWHDDNDNLQMIEKNTILTDFDIDDDDDVL